MSKSTVKPPAGKPTDSAARLILLGYQRVSRKHQIVARLDRPDWLAVLAADRGRAPADFYRRVRSGVSEPCPQWADHYLRGQSRDTLTIPDNAVFLQIPAAGTHAEYVDPSTVAEDTPVEAPFPEPTRPDPDLDVCQAQVDHSRLQELILTYGIQSDIENCVRLRGTRASVSTIYGALLAQGFQAKLVEG